MIGLGIRIFTTLHRTLVKEGRFAVFGMMKVSMDFYFC